MAAIVDPRIRRRPRTVRLAVEFIYFIVASLMAFVGVACTAIALAAGVKALDMLALVFFLGAAATLLFLVVWYLLQLRPR